MRHHGPNLLPALITLAALALLPAAGAAADREQAPAHQRLVRREIPSRAAARPRVSAALPERVRSRVLRAHEKATARVQERPACRDLFTELGADGAQLLAVSGYYAAGPARETSICRRAMATTRVGGGPVHVCRRFDALSDDEAAVVLLHEALHHAGLGERPQDPDGMEPSAISRKVRAACGL